MELNCLICLVLKDLQTLTDSVKFLLFKYKDLINSIFRTYKAVQARSAMLTIPGLGR